MRGAIDVTSRVRVDDLMARRGLVASRSRAADAIRRGTVTVDGMPATKAGQLVADDVRIEIDDPAAGYVSRGALKLISALDQFGFEPEGLNALDIGASTGGFTQVLLERGAAHVTAIDVGRGQLHETLVRNPRITSLEGTDARSLTTAMAKGPVGAIVVDVSFISLTKVLSAGLALAAPGCWLVALIKPQFEVGPELVGKGGVVRDVGARGRAVGQVKLWLEAQPGWTIDGVIPSPIEGGSGNMEFLLAARFRV